MGDGIQIIIYVIAFAIWIFSAIQKAKKKANESKPAMPIPSIEVETKYVESENSNSTIKEELLQETKQTYKKPNPYRGSTEYKKKIEARKIKQQKVPNEEPQSPVLGNIEEIDWKQAIIHSEILRPRF